MSARDPLTPEEWQDAVNLAKFCLLLDDARLLGLVTGGPGVDRDRCVEILEAGIARGWVPRDVDDTLTMLIDRMKRRGRGFVRASRTPEKSEG